MSGHPQFAEDLALYAIGALDRGQCTTLETHLDECSACRNELAELRGDASLLALSVSGPAAPQRSRERLLGAIGSEPHPVRVRMRRPWWSFAPVALAAMLAIFCVLLLDDNLDLRYRVDELKTQSSGDARQIAEAKMVLDTMMAHDAVHITLASAPAAPQPFGHCIYSAQHGALIFTASHMAPLPPNKTYELWLVPMNGHAPMPAGMFKPDAKGNAMVMTPPLPKDIEAKAFGVTIENEGGSQTPTMPLVLQGSGE
jgi:anti-sigma-K factor RskA